MPIVYRLVQLALTVRSFFANITKSYAFAFFILFDPFFKNILAYSKYKIAS